MPSGAELERLPTPEDLLCESRERRDRANVNTKAADGNANAMKTGHRSTRYGLVLSRLGKRSQSAMHDVQRFRSALEKKLSDGGKNQLGIRQLARIQTACRFEAAIRSMELAIREQDQDLPIMERLKLHEAIIRWANIRDAILTRLGAQKTGTGIEWNILDEDNDPSRSFRW